MAGRAIVVVAGTVEARRTKGTRALPLRRGGAGGCVSCQDTDNLNYGPGSRIFLVMGKYTPGGEPRQGFSPFRVVRDKNSKESKGMALVKFDRSSQARRAVEERHNQRLCPDGTKPTKRRVTTLACPPECWWRRETGLGSLLSAEAVLAAVGVVLPLRGGLENASQSARRCREVARRVFQDAQHARWLQPRRSGETRHIASCSDQAAVQATLASEPQGLGLPGLPPPLI